MSSHYIECLVAQAFYRFPSHSIECLIPHIARNIYTNIIVVGLLAGTKVNASAAPAVSD